ncbi:Ger(x)C family spore germination protein [Brevibacillus fortis]|uniref:Ger(x)C family spore germination protein n=1 Tax=Brevibacillus fortis TaxID=2126352 RepID=UPI002E1C459E|nr:Ger(x)C family spore germination protein [Brevibacillus fortis]
MKTLTAVMGLLIAICLGGCWNNIDLTETRFVTAVGIDLNEEGRYVLTVNIMKPSSGKADAGGSSGKSTIIQSTGYTIFDAARNMIEYSGYKLSYHHMQYLAIGTEAAKKDIIGPLDLFFRDQELSGRHWVLYVEGKAESLLRTKGNTNDIQPLKINEQMIASRSVGKYPPVRSLDLMRMLATKEKVGYIPISHPFKSLKESREAGAVIIKDGKAVSSINETQVRGLLWVTGKIKSTIVIVPLKKPGQYGSIEVLDSKAKIRPVLENNQLTIQITVHPHGIIGSLDHPIPMDSETYKWLQMKVNQIIKEEINAAVAIAKKNKADIFGFHDYVHRKYPKEWKVWEPQWPEHFSQLEVKVNVQSKLLLNGLLAEQLGEK